MISVLLPTRGRPKELVESVGSLYRLAKRPDEIEVMLWFDEDDPTRNQALDGILEPCPRPNLFVTVRPRIGYRRLYQALNLMARCSTGRWIFTWNDDAFMKTQNWDALLDDVPPHSVQLLHRDILPHADTTFPVLGRSVYLAMGEMSPTTHADTWAYDVAKEAGCEVFRDDIVVRHERFDDQTSRDRDREGYDIAAYNAPAMLTLRSQVAERVRKAKP